MPLHHISPNNLTHTPMKKLTFLSLIFALSSLLSFAQDKIIILDFYTDWCIPCKQMEKHIFSQQRVKDAINANFELRRINAEEGEGVAIASKYTISGYPTLLFINADDSEINRLQGAPLNSSFFLDILKIIKGRSIDISTMYESFKATSDEVKKLEIAQKLAHMGPPYYMLAKTENKRELADKVKVAVDYYFANKPVEDMINEKDFYIISMFLDGATNDKPQIEFIYKNYNRFMEVVPEADLAQFAVKVNNQSIQDCSRKGDMAWKKYVSYIDKELAYAYTYMGETGAKEMMECVANINNAVYVDKNFDRYITLRNKYTDLLIANGNDTKGNYLYAAQVLYRRSDGKLSQRQVTRGIEWLNKNVEEGFNLPATYLLLGDFYSLMPGKIAEAISSYNRCGIEAKKQGERVEARYLNIVKAKIEKLKSK